MTEPERDYLWTGEDPADPEVAAIEGELESLRWRPSPLQLPASLSVVVAPEQAPGPAKAKVHGPRGWGVDSRWWPALAAGFAAAAAVFIAMFWLRPTPAPSSGPTLERAVPGAPPRSPDLKDPFAGPDTSEQRGFETPSLGPDVPPAVPRRVSPDLKDPFAGPVESGTESRAEGGAKANKRISPDLEDPFAPSDASDSPGAQPSESGLTNPFTGEAVPRGSVNSHSPDLKDPFSSR